MSRRKLPNLGQLAFADEPRYVQNIHRFAMAVSSDTDDEGLALAANALPRLSAAKADLPAWNQKDYDEFMTLKAAKQNIKGPKRQQKRPNQPFVVPPPPPGASNNIQFGKICFNCGWNKNHNSKSCPVWPWLTQANLPICKEN
jgi:hypothetical protein